MYLEPLSTNLVPEVFTKPVLVGGDGVLVGVVVDLVVVVLVVVMVGADVVPGTHCE